MVIKKGQNDFKITLALLLAVTLSRANTTNQSVILPYRKYASCHSQAG